MSKTNKEMTAEDIALANAREFANVTVARSGTQIVLPNQPIPMALGTAIDTLKRLAVEENQEIHLVEHIRAYPFDAAIALMAAMREQFGWAEAVPTPGFWGATPPTMIDVEVGPNVRRKVAWGRFKIPGLEGFLQLQFCTEEGQPALHVDVKTINRDKAVFEKLIERAREIVKASSIYRGQAIRLVVDDDGDLVQNEAPRFIDIGNVTAKDLIFSRSVEEQIQTNLFTPICHTAQCRKAGVPLKRGVLLAGKYGTGKTLTADAVANACRTNGWTFILIPRVAALDDALAFARIYQPAVVFAEDIDRVMSGEDRSIEIDDILNTIDGVESKRSEIMTVLTTNHLELINRAMLRPGRLDAVINVTPPDAEAAERLIRRYGHGLIPDTEDLTEAGVELAGQIPAMIRECVERSKLYAITESNGGNATLTAGAIAAAARGMKAHMDLLNPPAEDEFTVEHRLGAALGEVVRKSLDEADSTIEQKIDGVHKDVRAVLKEVA